MSTAHNIASANIPFKKLKKKEKWSALLELCKTSKSIPKTHGVTEDVRVIGQFWLNMKASIKRNPEKHDTWELNVAQQVEHFAEKRLSRLEKITSIIKFTEEHKRTPSQSSKSDAEKKLGQSLNTLKALYSNNKMTESESQEFNKILKYRNNYQRTRLEKLSDVHQFCLDNNRTPKQHVTDLDEKRLAEFFSTTKLYAQTNALTPDEQVMFDHIMKFAPVTKKQKLDMLMTFVMEKERIPKMNSDDTNERALATFFTKLKANNKNSTIGHHDKIIFDKIVAMCQIKTRLEKIESLKSWIDEHGSHPRLNSDASDERKLAMFMNNIKQAHKKNKLNADEVVLFTSIVNSKVTVSKT